MPARLHARLSATRLSVDAAHAFVADPRAGATVVFTGVVRDHADGRAVARLTYEAYQEAAQGGLEELAATTATKWPDLTAVWLEHRVGDLDIGHAAVVVAVSAPHRAEAFEAGRFAIDTLKATVPIWKQEHWADGGTHWPGSD